MIRIRAAALSAVVVCAVGAAPANGEARLGRGAGRVPAPSRAPAVSATGFACDLGRRVTSDSEAYTRRYRRGGRLLEDREVGCVARIGHRSAAPRTGQIGSCGGGAALERAPGEWVQFADGETTVVCDAPEVDSAGQPGLRRARRGRAVVAADRFECGVTVATGTSGRGVTRVTDRDSVEFLENYPGPRGVPLLEIATACVGTVPGGIAVPSEITSHTISCSQLNPFGTGTIRGYGASVVYPDHQYEQFCDVPNWQILTDPTASDLPSAAGTAVRRQPRQRGWRAQGSARPGPGDASTGTGHPHAERSLT